MITRVVLQGWKLQGWKQQWWLQDDDYKGGNNNQDGDDDNQQNPVDLIEELQELREDITDLLEGQAYQQTEVEFLRLTFDQQSDEFQDDLNQQEDEFTDLLEQEIQQLQNENKNLSDQLSTKF